MKDRTTTYHGTILGELRVSKFLLDHLIDHPFVLSFRPGELSNSYALQATGYRFGSSVTANNSLTHLPFQLTYNRAARTEAPIFEFSITIEDEEAPLMRERLPQALVLVRQLATYGGAYVILIHPNILDHKLAFERGFVEAVKDQAWFGSVAQFGAWWSARNQVAVEVKRKGQDIEVRLQAPQKMAGLTLQAPRASCVCC